ncbi:MAG: putative glycolipid-binding domain-containing protein [Thermoanaerobaculia bacterium]
MNSILWRSVRWPGHEAARIVDRTLEGAAAFAQDGVPAQLRYAIACDRDWVTQRAVVTGWVGERKIDCDIVAANGVWTLNGVVVDAVRDCIDVDLNFSPSTNVLPIRRLGLSVGQSSTVRAAWLRFPSFNLELLEQTYTRTAVDTYVYSSGSFTAELQLDANGFVREYAGIWVAE